VLLAVEVQLHGATVEGDGGAQDASLVSRIT
jgi:hypothetical protein